MSRTVLRGLDARRVRSVPFDVDLDREDLAGHSLDAAATAEAVAAGRAAGFEAGYSDGYTAGVAAAEAAVRADAAARAAQVQQAIHALSAAATDLRARAAVDTAAIEDDIVEAAFAIAEMVLDRELSVAEAPGRDAIARALAIAPSGDATARLNPADVAGAGEAGAEFGAEFGRDVTIVADPTVEPGGCIVEIGACTVDAQIGAALERVRGVLGLPGVLRVRGVPA